MMRWTGRKRVVRFSDGSVHDCIQTSDLRYLLLCSLLAAFGCQTIAVSILQGYTSSCVFRKFQLGTSIPWSTSEDFFEMTPQVDHIPDKSLSA